MMDDRLLNMDLTKDVCSCVCSDGKSVMVDLQTICPYSGYFSALRQSEMQETLSKTITFHLISSDMLNLVTNLVHQYSITKTWTPLFDNMTLPVIEDVLFASDYLDITPLRIMCDSWLTSTCNLTETSYFAELLLLSYRYDLQSLNKEIYAYCKSHIMIIKDALSVLDALSFDLAKHVLQSDDTEVDSEWDLVDCICKIFNYNDIIQSEEYPGLLQLIRMPRLLVAQNHQAMMDELDNEIVKTFLKTAFSHYKSKPNKYMKTFPWQFCIRRPKKAIVCLRIPFTKSLASSLMIAPVHDKHKQRIKTKDPLSTQDILQISDDIPKSDSYNKPELKFHNVPDSLRGIATRNLREFSVAKLERSVYVAGGQLRYSLAGQFAISSVMRLDLDTLQWHLASCMLSKRCLFSLVPADGQLIAVGGVNSDGELSSAEMFNPHDQTWTAVTSLDYPVHEHSGCVHKDDVYISGGHNGHHPLNTVSCYNLATQQWRGCAPLQLARSYHSMIECGGKLFVIGGCKFRRRQLMSVQICEVYNMAANQWTLMVSEFPTHFTACLSIWQSDSDIILVGGYSFRQQKYRTKRYVLHTEDFTWAVERVNFPNRTFGWKEAIFLEVLLSEKTYRQTFIDEKRPV